MVSSLEKKALMVEERVKKKYWNLNFCSDQVLHKLMNMWYINKPSCWHGSAIMLPEPKVSSPEQLSNYLSLVFYLSYLISTRNLLNPTLYTKVTITNTVMPKSELKLENCKGIVHATTHNT